MNLKALAAFMPGDQPLYGLQPKGFDGPSDKPHRSVEEMAEYYIHEIRKIQPSGPYYLLGTCFGGTVVFEMAHQLRARGQEMGLLGVLDTLEPPGRKKKSRKKRNHGRGIRRFNSQRIKTAVLALFKSPPRKRKRQIVRILKHLHIPSRLSMSPLDRRIQLITGAHFGARRAYKPRPYPGQITCFWSGMASEQRAQLRSEWAAMSTEELIIHIFHCKHSGFFKKPHVSELASKIAECVPIVSGESAPS